MAKSIVIFWNAVVIIEQITITQDSTTLSQEHNMSPGTIIAN